MSIKDIWNKLFGVEDEIDFSVPLQAPALRSPGGVFTNTSKTADIKITIEGEDPIILSPGTSHQIPDGKTYSVHIWTAPIKSRVRARSVTAHGKAPSKSKRRSSSKKKPDAIKRKKLGR